MEKFKTFAELLKTRIEGFRPNAQINVVIVQDKDEKYEGTVAVFINTNLVVSFGIDLTSYIAYKVNANGSMHEIVAILNSAEKTLEVMAK